MKREKSIRNYYDEYLELCRSIPRTTGLPDLCELLKKENSSNSLSLPFVTCLIDYSKSSYEFISDNCKEIIGYSNSDYIEGGLDSHVIHFHPDDLVIYAEQVFRDIQEFWKQIDLREINKYRFSFNQRHFRNDGTIAQLIQHATYLEPQYSGMPALNLTTCSDISDFKTDVSIVLSISRFVKGEGYVKVFTKTYSHAKQTPFSARETEIIRLCIEGLASKMIADKLFISIQTVKNHKRNMMKKTSAGNITGLINLSVKNNWI